MSVHHAQAVEMAEIARDRTQNPRIRTLATDISLTQQAQIGRMQGWLDVWGLPPTSVEPAMTWMGHPTEGRMPGMASRAEINRLRKLPPDQMDRLFLRLMIPHHQAAIPMSNAVLERTDRQEVRSFAEGVIAAQRAEIETMRQMLRDMGETPPEKQPPSREDHEQMSHDH
jgi:uncharacterized protein (DUF305 family)